ncbi:hypothetical protein [Alteromonas flava]|uniref:hypothetical protein n=1 Tax=Alteromonas flava TaxID=2048003 RepID=UPI000C2863D2|nr:hypothetical protein [Alteromonas flava]
MASQYKLKESLIVVTLTGDVYAHDVMSVHKDPEFLRLCREYLRVVYDYSQAESIAISEDNAMAFAKLAIIESGITPQLRIGVIAKDPSHRKGAQFYAETANAAGANVIVVDSIYQFLEQC